MIVFGGKTPAGWVVDTVLVVRDFIDFDFVNHREMLASKVPDAYWEVTLAPTFTSDWNRSQRFRLYQGATANDPVDGMFSFFPAVLEDGGETGVPRPVLDLPKPFFSPRLTQGAKGHGLYAPAVNREDMASLWGTIADQVKDQGLLLGTRASSPPTRPDGMPE